MLPSMRTILTDVIFNSRSYELRRLGSGRKPDPVFFVTIHVSFNTWVALNHTVTLAMVRIKRI